MFQVGDLQAQVHELELALRQCHNDLAKSQAAEHELQQLLQRLWRKYSELKLKIAHQDKLRAQANQAELNHFKISMIAQDTQKGMSKEFDELSSIKSDLQRLLHQTPIVEGLSKTLSSSSVEDSVIRPHFVRESPKSGNSNSKSRLVKERDMLLQSGMYAASDPLIATLTAQIDADQV
jgi:hypothetical protein